MSLFPNRTKLQRSVLFRQCCYSEVFDPAAIWTDITVAASSVQFSSLYCVWTQEIFQTTWSLVLNFFSNQSFYVMEESMTVSYLILSSKRFFSKITERCGYILGWFNYILPVANVEELGLSILELLCEKLWLFNAKSKTFWLNDYRWDNDNWTRIQLSGS